ncbi:MAG: hypothetical protein ABIN01_21270 [Ferruginibacter sp.]
MGEQQRGLKVYVYRSAVIGDCTNGGITSKHDRLTIVGTVDYRTGDQPVISPLDKHDQVFEPKPDSPAAWLVVGKYGSRDRYVVPAGTDGQPDPRWWMHGGNLVSSSDARWSDLVDAQYGVRVHDRHEG